MPVCLVLLRGGTGTTCQCCWFPCTDNVCKCLVVVWEGCVHGSSWFCRADIHMVRDFVMAPGGDPSRSVEVIHHGSSR